MLYRNITSAPWDFLYVSFVHLSCNISTLFNRAVRFDFSLLVFKVCSFFQFNGLLMFFNSRYGLDILTPLRFAVRLLF